jgi:hypothetical protein
MKEMEEDLLCPSYVAKPGALLFGVVNRAGFINYLSATLEVTEGFIEEGTQGRPLETRFRFAGKCAKGACKQWQSDKKNCGLTDQVIDIFQNTPPLALAPCPIREKCRWYRQQQSLACAQCNEIIRNIEIQATAQPEPAHKACL